MDAVVYETGAEVWTGRLCESASEEETGLGAEEETSDQDKLEEEVSCDVGEFHVNLKCYG